MGQKQSLPPPQAAFFCPQTGIALESPLGVCDHCQAAHDIIWQSVYVCQNTGYRIELPRSRRPHKECPSCFQAHQPFSKRVYICPVTGAQIAHPRETGGRCQKCNRSHEDNSTPLGSRETMDGQTDNDMTTVPISTI
ncbi:DNA polymerase II large subunit [Echria macrotheca]|uniref:DNA polymerase II large subunit n=1 Tax=Echria macrotheca TaxID=438768 RepID=A0AAJ0B341_9PEZI|nr:DNA polymerase II large subunit [Echria macrotheca]